MEQLIDEFSHPTYTSFPVVAARLLWLRSSAR